MKNELHSHNMTKTHREKDDDGRIKKYTHKLYTTQNKCAPRIFILRQLNSLS